MSHQDAVTGSALDGDDLSITYVGGASRDWAPKLVSDLALSGLSGEVRLYDVEPEGAELNARFGNWVQENYETEGQWRYAAYEDRGEALSGADVVITSTQYDPTETFVPDLDIPLSYGIRGAVAGTIGPGGLFRLMRTAPVYRDFADAIREHCPDAWVANFTNPVHGVTRALYDEYPEINAVGLCHEVGHVKGYLADLASEHLDMDATAADVSVNVKGINHFTWTDEFRVNGVDCWPLLERLADEPEANETFTPADMEDESVFVDNQQVAWELFRRFGVFPIAGDRHLLEYATWFTNGDPQDMNRWGVKRTTSEFRAKHWNPAESEHTTDVEAWLEGDREFELTESSEEFADIVAALAGREPMRTNVNVPNEGQIDDLDRGAVVETDADIRAGELTPISAGSFPRPVRSMIATHVDSIETIIEASRTGDVDLAFQGFAIDPQVRTLPMTEVTDMFAELAAEEREYLTDWNLEESEVLAASEKF